MLPQTWILNIISLWQRFIYAAQDGRILFAPTMWFSAKIVLYNTETDSQTKKQGSGNVKKYQPIFLLIIYIIISVPFTVAAPTDILLWADDFTLYLPDTTDYLDSLKDEIDGYLSDKAGDWSVYVKNLDTDVSFSINNKEMSPASTIKLFNMVALYDSVNKNEVTMSNTVKSNLNSMITQSDNNASNIIVSTVGGGSFAAGAKKVTELASELGCTDTQEEHILYSIAPASPGSGKNTTSVEDCGLILENIYRKRCVSATYDQEMLDLLLAQTRTDGIPLKLPGDTPIANKTGENSKVVADVGLVFSENCDYVICVIVNGYKNTATACAGIAEISKKVYDYFN